VDCFHLNRSGIIALERQGRWYKDLLKRVSKKEHLMGLWTVTWQPQYSEKLSHTSLNISLPIFQEITLLTMFEG
jgi:hypothetical protein